MFREGNKVTSHVFLFSSPTALLPLVRRTILRFHEEAQLVEGEPHFDEMNRVEKG